MGEGELSRRVVRQISKYPEPKEIFKLIKTRGWDYALEYRNDYWCRDRAMMALCFCSAGRITEVVGGPQYEVQLVGKKDKAVIVGEHPGLNRDDLVISNSYITISNMKVVKRSRKVIQKYGESVTRRDDFIIPLKCDLYTNRFWNQLVPFGWVILEYLQCFSPKNKLFPYSRQRAWQIIRAITGMFPNWFRAQAEHFYGHFLITDSVKLAKFVKVVRPEQIGHYIGYSWTEQLKESESPIDFNWIEDEVKKTKIRIAKKGQIERKGINYG